MHDVATLTELTIIIADDLSALLRVVSVLHSRAITVDRLHVGEVINGTRSLDLLVDERQERRVVQALERCVPVLSVLRTSAAPSS